MKFSLLARKWHRWLALIIGVQIFLWTFSGLYMSFVPIEKIRSEHHLKKIEPYDLKKESGIYPIGQILEKVDSSALLTQVHLKTILGQPTYEVRLSDKSIQLFDGKSGQKISPIEKGMAQKIAVGHFLGESSVENIVLLKEPLIEYRGKYPVWKIDFDNLESTSFYVSPESGQVTARRGILWRIYDFLWMLHIMDYSERDNFNNWWLVIAAGLAVIGSISGLILLRFSFRWKKLLFWK